MTFKTVTIDLKTYSVLDLEPDNSTPPPIAGENMYEACAHAGRIHVLSPQSTLHSFDLVTRRWSSRPTSESGRPRALTGGSLVWKGNLCVFDTGEPLLHMLNLDTATWKVVRTRGNPFPPLSEAECRAIRLVPDNRMLLIRAKMSCDAWIFDMETKTWSFFDTVGMRPGEMATSASYTIYRERAFVLSGMTQGRHKLDIDSQLEPATGHIDARNRNGNNEIRVLDLNPLFPFGPTHTIGTRMKFIHEGELCDFRIECRGRVFDVHKAVLSQNPNFRDLILSCTGDHVEWPFDEDPSVLEKFIWHFYGKYEPEEGRFLAALYRLADMMDETLLKVSIVKLVDGIKDHRVMLDLFSVAHSRNLRDSPLNLVLSTKINRVVRNNKDTLLCSKEFEEFCLRDALSTCILFEVMANRDSHPKLGGNFCSRWGE